ncbi:MAG: carbon-nitrogen hydrolase family protein [Sphingomonadaceae bacterium]
MLKVGLVQTCTGIDPPANATMLASDVNRLADQGAEVIFTPEMCGQLDSRARRLAENGHNAEREPTLKALRAVAAERKVMIAIGSLAIATGYGRFVNRSYVIGPDGDILQQYDKLHLFDVDLPNGETYRESKVYDAGDAVRLASLPWGKLGLTICYDLRFPQLFASLALAGAQVIAVPAAFTRQTGEAHWHVLLRARAIETGAFIVAAAQSGQHEDGRETFGHSLVIDPWGQVILDMGTEPGIATAELDLSRVDDTRARIPSLRHRRSLPHAEVAP